MTATPSNTFLVVPWVGEAFDKHNFHNSTQPSRLTVSIAGYYEIVYALHWMGNATGPFDLNIRANGNDLRHVDVFFPDPPLVLRLLSE